MRLTNKTYIPLVILLAFIGFSGVVVHLRNSHYHRQIDLARATIRINPKSYNFLNVCGSYYRRTGNVTRSRKYRNRALKYDRRVIQVRLLKAMMLEEAGKKKEALAMYERCFMDGKYSRYAVRKQIRIHMNMGNLDRAEEIFTLFLQNENVTRFPNFFLVGTELYLRKKDRDSAKMYLRMALDRHPCTSSIWFEIGLQWKRLGDVPKAVAAYEESLRLDPDNHRSQKELAPLYMEKGKRGQAMKLFQKLMDANKAGFMDILNFGRCYSESNLFIMAAELYKQANLLQPANYHAHFNLGAIYVNNFKWYAEAAAEFRKALYFCDSDEKRNILIRHIHQAEKMGRDSL